MADPSKLLLRISLIHLAHFGDVLGLLMAFFLQVHFRHSESISKICGVILRNSHSLTPEESQLGKNLELRCKIPIYHASPNRLHHRSSLLWSLAELNVRDRTLLVQKILDRGSLICVYGVPDAGGTIADHSVSC